MVIWNRFLVLMSMVSCVFVGPLAAADSLPDPDGKAADLNQPVQVYILLGPVSYTHLTLPTILLV